VPTRSVGTRRVGLTQIAGVSSLIAEKSCSSRSMPVPVITYAPRRSCPFSPRLEEKMKVSQRILASVAGALALAVSVSAQAPAQKPAAVVNGEAIPQSELEAVI